MPGISLATFGLTVLIVKILASVLALAYAYRIILKNSKTADISFSKAVLTSLCINGMAYAVEYGLEWAYPRIILHEWMSILAINITLFLGLFFAYKKRNPDMKFAAIQSLKTILAVFVLVLIA